MLIIETKHRIFISWPTYQSRILCETVNCYYSGNAIFPGVGSREILGLLPLWRVDTPSRIINLGYIPAHWLCHNGLMGD